MFGQKIPDSLMQVISEGPVKISRTTIESAAKRRQPGQRIVIRGGGCRGLALVVNPNGLTWRFDFRPRGLDPATGKRWPMQSIVVGNPETHGPESARTAAGELKGQARSGIDIQEQRRERLDRMSRRRASTVTRLLPTYELALASRQKLRGTGLMSPPSLEGELSHLRLAVAAMGVADKPVESVSVVDIKRLLDHRAGQPATARKHFGAVRRFLEWARENNYVASNAASALPKLQRPRAVASRTICPTIADLSVIWRAAESLDPIERDFTRLLIAIPARLREVARMRWEDVDLIHGTWSLPASAMKTRTAHAFFIPNVALEILRERAGASAVTPMGLVLQAPRSAKALTTFTSVKRRLKAKMHEPDRQADVGLTRISTPNWTWHDFRRAFATACAENGVAKRWPMPFCRTRNQRPGVAFWGPTSEARGGPNSWPP